MNKIGILALLNILWILFPLTIYAGGNRERVDVTIENRTNTRITQIIIDEMESNKKPKEITRSIEKNGTTVLQLKKGTLYGIILINTDERQYAKKRQSWDNNTASIVFEHRDILDRNIWDKILRIVLWPQFL
ncbi:MAG: hypothetical protein FWB86_10220 [Treponema sp.]|nr:hypothetical protein [Treponema sp.]